MYLKLEDNIKEIIKQFDNVKIKDLSKELQLSVFLLIGKIPLIRIKEIIKENKK